MSLLFGASVRCRPLPRQRGIVMPIFVVGLVAIIAMAGLALDGGHMLLNKTRLQNTVDAAALSAAKTLDQTSGNMTMATSEALRMFSVNTMAAGNGELADSYGGGGMNVAIQFSNTLDPFVPGTLPAQYVRVRADDMRLQAWFIRVLGIDQKVIGATAVAGPSPTLNNVCNIAPMMVCGDPAAGAPHYGYQIGMATVLKTAASGGNFEVGPGNFQLIRLGGSPGAAVVREALAGNFDACVDMEDDIETQPGNAVGPVAQGLNTRLGIYSGPMGNRRDEFPPDVVVQQVAPRLSYNASTRVISYQGSPILAPADVNYFNHEAYEARVGALDFDYLPVDGNPSGPGVQGRRILATPVGDCSTAVNGQGTVEAIGMLCFHILQEAVQQGNEAHVYGEFIGGGCGVTGVPGPVPGSGPGPYVIQLYKDPDGSAS